MSNILLSFFKGKTPQSVKWEEVREQILDTIHKERDGFAMIRPFKKEDARLGQIEVKVSPYFSILSINGREYYFDKETGEFDGTAFTPKAA